MTHARTSVRALAPRRLVAQIPVLVAVLCLPALADPAELHLFVRPESRDSADSAEASNLVETVLKRMLRKQFPDSLIQSVTPDQVTHPTVEDYAEEYNIAHYLEVEVDSTPGGLLMELVLVAEQNREPFSTWVGAGGMDNPGAVRARLRGILLLYSAMLLGIDREDLIYVMCFGVRDPGGTSILLQKSLTVQLPSRLGETPMSDRYLATGVDPLDFNRHCLEPGGITQEEEDFMRDFSFVIEGFVQHVQDGVEIPILVYMSGGVETLNPPAFDEDSAVDDLAEHIARCWENWDDPGCKQ